MGAAGTSRRLRSFDRALPHCAVTPQCFVLISAVFCYIYVARNSDFHRIKYIFRRCNLLFEVFDALPDDFGRSKLVKQQIEASLSNFFDRRFAAGSRPDWRVRPLTGSRLDDDVLEFPEPASVRKSLV